MTKKHFIALADMVRNQRPMLVKGDRTDGPYWNGRLESWQRMRDALADFCQSQNSQFKRDRWLSYINGECGPNGGAR